MYETYTVKYSEFEFDITNINLLLKFTKNKILSNKSDFQKFRKIIGNLQNKNTTPFYVYKLHNSYFVYFVIFVIFSFI